MQIRDLFNDKLESPYIIAEVSQNHDGSLGQAHAFIDAVADVGVDAIKFQTHIADEESTIYEPFRVNFSFEDKTRYDYWKRMEFTAEQWEGLYSHANERGLEFLSSPFSIKALELLDKIGVPAWKFGAGEVFNYELLRRAINTKKPIMLSTGLSTYDDIDQQVTMIREKGNNYLLFQCVTAYPSSADMIDIQQIQRLREKYKCPVGISDHSATIYPALAATTLGAMAIEVHVTMSHAMFGPDVKASVDLNQLAQIVEGTRYISKMLHNFNDLVRRSSSQEELKQMFSKSLYAVESIPEGTVLKKELFKLKKPNIGIQLEDFSKYENRITIREIKEGDPLRAEDVE